MQHPKSNTIISQSKPKVIMSKLSIIAAVCVLAISVSVICAQKDGKYRPNAAIVGTKKPLFSSLGQYNPTENEGKYNPNERAGKYTANENDGKYRSGGDDGKYTNSNRQNKKTIKIVKNAGPLKPKAIVRAATLHKNVIRATPTKVPAQPLPQGRGTSVGRNDFKVVSESNEPEVDGYHFGFQTENGIVADEEGRIENLPTGEGIRTKGFFEYTGDDGALYRVDYVADDSGFVPKGAHIHPTPPHVVKLLEFLASNAKK